MEPWQQDAALSRAHQQWLEPPDEPDPEEEEEEDEEDDLLEMEDD